MPETEYIAKTDAIAEVRRITGFGHHIINRIMDELAEQGTIAILDDLIDKRKKVLSREHVELIIATLQARKQRG